MPHFVEALPKLAQLYPTWQAKGIEVIFVSLDEQVMDFAQIAGALPFVSTCDYQKWESTPVKDYHVFGTPTYFILKENLEIVLKPTSVEQISEYFDWVTRW